jgi:uncharacterized membrane protein (UPF0182 family)
MMPTNVRNFLVLSYVSLLLSIIEVAVTRFENLQASPFSGGDTFDLTAKLVAAAFITLYGIVIALAGWGRRDWARWLLLTVFIFGVVFDVLSLSETLRSGSLADLLSWAETAFQGTALYLIFTGDAKSWFRRDATAIS